MPRELDFFVVLGRRVAVLTARHFERKGLVFVPVASKSTCCWNFFFFLTQMASKFHLGRLLLALLPSCFWTGCVLGKLHRGSFQTTLLAHPNKFL